MGQQQLQRHVCCMGKEHGDYYDPTLDVPAPESPSRKHAPRLVAKGGDKLDPEDPRDRDIQGLRQGLTSLTQIVGDMQGEMLRLRAENGQLQLAHSEISLENSTLRETINDQQMQRDWDKLDVIEEHYRQLEQHRCAVDSGEIYLPDTPQGADEAAGSPACAGQKKVAPSWPVTMTKELNTPRQGRISEGAPVVQSSRRDAR